MGIYAENLPAAVVEQLRAERAAKQWTYDQLAEASGLTAQSVMRYLTGKRAIPLDVLAALADGLGVAPVEIMNRAVERIHQ